MRTLDILYAIYYWLPNFGRFGLPGKAVNRIMAIILKRIFDATVPRYLERTAASSGFGLNSNKREIKYIVSLTSFPARINQVWVVIELLLRQSFKPDSIILWLSEEQFPDKKVPENLNKLKERGLIIEFCKDDLRAHKKYYYAFKNFPNAHILTVDDDLYYDSKLLENLIIMQSSNPGAIVTNRAHKLRFDSTGNAMSYKNWSHNVTEESASLLLVPTGGGGTLYPIGGLPAETFEVDLIKRLCFHADDIWLKMMSLRTGTMVVTNGRYNKDFITVGSTQTEKLVLQNVKQGGNDDQLKNVLAHFQMDIKELVSQQ